MALARNSWTLSISVRPFYIFRLNVIILFSAFGPEPGRYNLKSDFNAITKSTKKIVEYSKDQGTHLNVPGPGTYQHEDTLGKTGN